MNPDRLCFGTSTFAAGRLRPDIDSSPGITALRVALDAGVRLIHSNPKLGTQWAIRRAIAEAGNPPGVRHLVKVEIPLDLDEDGMREAINKALDDSRGELGCGQIYAAIIEPDLKKTACRPCLVDYQRLAHFYERSAGHVLKTGQASAVFAFCHSRAYLAASLHAGLVEGCAAQYNTVEAWPALYLDRVASSRRSFTAMAPLRRGALVRGTFESILEKMKPLRWVLGHPAVSHVAITISSSDHLAEVLQAMENPLPVRAVHDHIRIWHDSTGGCARTRDDHATR